jgi:hypothetical protein
MPSVIYSRFFMDLALKALNWDTDDIRCVLVDSTYSAPNKDSTRWVTGSDPFDQEVVGSGYVAGGTQLANTTATQDDANDLVKLDADDVTWQTSTITAQAAVLFDSTIANKNLIACYLFTELKSSANGNFTIQWSGSGLMELKQGT